MTSGVSDPCGDRFVADLGSLFTKEALGLAVVWEVVAVFVYDQGGCQRGADHGVGDGW